MGDDLAEHATHEGYRNHWERVNIDSQEMSSILAWLNWHRVTCSKDVMIAQSGSSGIGTNTVVRCACGAGKDVTDYGSW